MIITERVLHALTVRDFLLCGFLPRDDSPFLCRTPAVIDRASRSRKTTPRRRRARGATRTQTRPDIATFSELLDNLDGAMDSLQMPTLRYSWICERDAKALRKIGSYVPTPWTLPWGREPRLAAGVKRCNIASCVLHVLPEDIAEDLKHDVVPARFAFALRAPALPPTVAPCAGTPYQFGYCFGLGETRNGPDDHLYWSYAWLVVNDDGEVFIPQEKTTSRAAIQHRNGPRESRYESVSLPQWGTQKSCVLREGAASSDKRAYAAAQMFCALLEYWDAKDQSWSVAIRKDGRRVTFSIAQEHTAYYFRDRNRAVTEGGYTKKIIHYVREHTRENGSRVRAHVRGLSAFEWKGFSCVVTAPKLRGNIFTNIDVEPYYGPDDDLEPKPGEIDLLRLTEGLTAHEDRLCGGVAP